MLAFGAAIAAGACSLLTADDGLSGGGSPPSSEGGAPPLVDGSVDTPELDAAETKDASDSLLSCNARDLVAYWPMDEGNGEFARECAGRYAAAFGGPAGIVSWTTRDEGGAIGFSGLGGVLLVSHAPAFEITGALTVAGWFRYDAVPDEWVGVFSNIDTQYGGYELALNPSREISFEVSGASTATAAVSLVMGGWRHVAGVFEPGVRVSLYVGGVLASTSTVNVPQAAGIFRSQKKMGVLHPTGAGTFVGALDDVRVYARALDASEIALLAR